MEALRSADPDSIGPYHLLGRLGEGGMGTVFLGRRDGAGPRVAIKVIRPSLAVEPEFRRRFQREVEQARQVPPFCTAEVLDADPDAELPYLVVEYVNGPTLASVIAEHGPLTPANLHGLSIGVATALTAIHGVGIVHRDLKPANVLLAPGSPKVIDFGIARGLHVTQSLTEANQLVGSIAYMAPERFADGRPTMASDIFAWGVIVAYAGAGRLPFPGDSTAGIVARILGGQPDLAGLSAPLRPLVAAALATDPAQRPTARELVNHLISGAAHQTLDVGRLIDRDQIVGGSETPPTPPPTQPPPPTPAAPATRRRGAGRGLIITLNVAVLAMTALVAALVAGVIRIPPALVPVGAAGEGGGGSSVAPSPAPAGPPSASAPGVPADAELLVRDQLTVPGHWIAQSLKQWRCDFGDGSLSVYMDTTGSYRCRGPYQPAEDVGAFVDVTLVAPGSCAGVWFRFYDNRGYALRVCPEKLQLVAHEQARVEPLRAFRLNSPIATGVTARIGVVARGERLVSYRDGVVVGETRDATFIRGNVVLGLFQTDAPEESGLPTKVRFDDIEIWKIFPGAPQTGTSRRPHVDNQTRGGPAAVPARARPAVGIRTSARPALPADRA
ncbi:serine/threonine-protein kinase [Pilimelia columellifera]|uniref:Protein kinase domain-containing protein n=1 Tax=Pilimelia columellifera subsp. columellifera TaxID=706583 RepID=A0ABN3NAE9_9ACTN